MVADKFDQFEDALFEFVKRASKDGATAEEIAALPAIAETLRLIAERWD